MCPRAVANFRRYVVNDSPTFCGVFVFFLLPLLRLDAAIFSIRSAFLSLVPSSVSALRVCAFFSFLCVFSQSAAVPASFRSPPGCPPPVQFAFVLMRPALRRALAIARAVSHGARRRREPARGGVPSHVVSGDTSATEAASTAVQHADSGRADGGAGRLRATGGSGGGPPWWGGLTARRRRPGRRRGNRAGKNSGGGANDDGEAGSWQRGGAMRGPAGVTGGTPRWRGHAAAGERGGGGAAAAVASEAGASGCSYGKRGCGDAGGAASGRALCGLAAVACGYCCYAAATCGSSYNERALRAPVLPCELSNSLRYGIGVTDTLTLLATRNS